MRNATCSYCGKDMGEEWKVEEDSPEEFICERCYDREQSAYSDFLFQL